MQELDSGGGAAGRGLVRPVGIRVLVVTICRSEERGAAVENILGLQEVVAGLVWGLVVVAAAVCDNNGEGCKEEEGTND